MEQQKIISELIDMYGETVTSSDLRGYCALNGISYANVTAKLEIYKSSRGKWNFKISPQSLPSAETQNQTETKTEKYTDSLVPVKDTNFVSFGNFSDIKKIIQSNIFYPVFITGLSGNGKTVAVEQACAQLKREMIRFNITIETDSDDLIGGFRISEGSTVWHNGPVVEAMERGAILLLDECDLASNKIMVLQSVLEGKPLFLKKINKLVTPKPGFNIIATANTKGKGSEDGRFIGTNVMNEAFLERFSVTFEQSYPSPSIENKILTKFSNSLGLDDCEDFIKRLVEWSDTIRKVFFDGGVDELISTRRLIHIIRAYAIFKNKAKAIKLAVARFDDDTKTSFLEFYDKIDETFDQEQQKVNSEDKNNEGALDS